MRKTFKQPKKRHHFIVGMIAAVLSSLVFWGFISLWYSGHSDTDYKLTPVLIIFAMPVHIGLLGIISIWFRANNKRFSGFTFYLVEMLSAKLT
jgi:hypothetical protein